jgi:hypothetical protein
MQTVASRENDRNAGRRISGSSGQTTNASWMRPPIHRHAAERCAQSASCDFHEEPASAAECPESDSPDAKPRPSKNASQRSAIRSVSQARKRNALTTAKPSVIAMKAVPKRECAIGVRSP